LILTQKVEKRKIRKMARDKIDYKIRWFLRSNFNSFILTTKPGWSFWVAIKSLNLSVNLSWTIWIKSISWLDWRQSGVVEEDKIMSWELNKLSFNLPTTSKAFKASSSLLYNTWALFSEIWIFRSTILPNFLNTRVKKSILFRSLGMLLTQTLIEGSVFSWGIPGHFLFLLIDSTWSFTGEFRNFL